MSDPFDDDGMLRAFDARIDGVDVIEAGDRIGFEYDSVRGTVCEVEAEVDRVVSSPGSGRVLWDVYAVTDDGVVYVIEDDGAVSTVDNFNLHQSGKNPIEEVKRSRGSVIAFDADPGGE